MFTYDQRQEERTGRNGTSRLQYLQELVSQFQSSTNEESKEKIVANLANFAYDPYNCTYLRQAQCGGTFSRLHNRTKLEASGIWGRRDLQLLSCNADPVNAAVIVQCGGIPLIVQCLSIPVRNTVNCAIGSLYYLCNASNKEEIVKPEVVDIMKRYAAAKAASVSFSNLANAFLEKHVS